MTRHHLVRAPSNIALIKYMGKSDAQLNLPENPSLSLTLHDLATWVSIENGAETALDGIELASGRPDGAPDTARAPALSDAGRAKALRHCARVRAEAERLLPAHGLRFEAAPKLVVRTANTFPEASGIASSASSFAALTLAVALACAREPADFARALDQNPKLRQALARVSRLGSGSSCRSFEGPWVRWEGEDAQAISAARLPELQHFVVLVSQDAKSISSSEAHTRVKTSPLWIGRSTRARDRLEQLTGALTGDGGRGEADLVKMARLAWSEAWEMHSLFHTSAEPFSYWRPGTIELLHALAPFVAGPNPPIVTLDAGPNVHVTVPRAEGELWRARLGGWLAGCPILTDRPGRGAEVVS